MCRLKHVEQLRNIGTINSTTRSHLVGYFYTICVMMHGFMNIKWPLSLCICEVLSLILAVDQRVPLLKILLFKELNFDSVQQNYCLPPSGFVITLVEFILFNCSFVHCCECG